MLENEFLPKLGDNRMRNELCIFQHDTAQAHCAKSMCRRLDETFPNKWMGQGSLKMLWQPRSPDFSICNSFAWGFVKEMHNKATIQSTEEFKEHIGEAL